MSVRLMNAARRASVKRSSRPPPPNGGEPGADVVLGSATTALISSFPVRRGSKAVSGRRADLLPLFLIADNRLKQRGLDNLLGAQGLKVIATARNGNEALRQVKRHKPKLLLLDFALGDRVILRLAGAVRKISLSIRMIVMHLDPAHEDVVSYVRAGVHGIVMKGASITELVATVRAVANGESVIPPLMVRALFAHVERQSAPRGKSRARATVRSMTGRERQVMAMIAQGLGNKAIGTRLRIATQTVKSHVHNILEKLALSSRLEVAAYAHAHR